LPWSGAPGTVGNCTGLDRRSGAGVASGCQPFICAMRRWLPNGSRSPKSMP
jgi:hypothetical protein